MKRAYILYNKRSCETGRELYNTLREGNVGGFRWRRASRRPALKDHSLVLRWGNSYLPTSVNAVELNNRDAVMQTTDKLAMINFLDRAEGVTIPEMVLFPADNDYQHLLVDGHAFFRNRSDQIRYRQSAVLGDKYVLKPINKVREFRVHVFDNKVLGVYEKLPEGEDVVIYKNENCEFKRLDMADDAVRKSIKGVRPMAKAAVSSLGLLFGGVDVIMDEQSNIFVTEVNSAPSLNTLNLDRWVTTIQEYITSQTEQE